MIIATRELIVATSEADVAVKIALYLPEISDGMWLCRYKIDWPDQIRTSFAAGVDAVQAIHQALQKIGMELYISPYHASGRLRWEHAGDGYGFPVPKNGRDMLIGSDRIFEG